MIAIIYSNGQIDFSELRFDCRENKWMPLADLKYKDGRVSIPCFEQSDIAKQFARRNLPKQWVRGGVELGDDEQDFIRNKGWNIEIFNFPKLFKTHPNIVLGFEVLDFTDKPAMLYT